MNSDLTGKLLDSGDSEQMVYGENPHQEARLIKTDATVPGAVNGTRIQGPPLSYNNILDADAAFALASEFHDGAAAVIVKHNNPCGVGIDETLHEAYIKARDCDRTSAFGGIAAFNSELDADTAAEITGLFTEVVIAPGASDEAKGILAAKERLRVILTGAMLDESQQTQEFRSVLGGILVQDRDAVNGGFEPVTERQPSDMEIRNLWLAWKIAKHAKSNSIVLVKDSASVGIGAGQVSRVAAAKIAVENAGDGTIWSVAASDGFLPFADGLEVLASAGVSALIQPGGSRNDDEIIAKANENGMAMVFTRIRHFRH